MQVYVALTGVFVASTILLLVTLVLVIMLLFIDYKKGIRGKDTFAIQCCSSVHFLISIGVYLKLVYFLYPLYYHFHRHVVKQTRKEGQQSHGN